MLVPQSRRKRALFFCEKLHLKLDILFIVNMLGHWLLRIFVFNDSWEFVEAKAGARVKFVEARIFLRFFLLFWELFFTDFWEIVAAKAGAARVIFVEASPHNSNHIMQVKKDQQKKILSTTPASCNICGGQSPQFQPHYAGAVDNIFFCWYFFSKKY